MAYDTEGYEGAGHRGGYIQDDRRAGRADVEEEPSDLDQPVGDGLEDDGDELEDLGIAPAGGAADDDEDEEESEKPGPLAEDVPMLKAKRGASGDLRDKKILSLGRSADKDSDAEEGYELAAALGQDEDAEETAGIRSGGSDVAVMSDGDRRREFPHPTKAAAKTGARRAAKRKPRKAKLARA